MVVTDETVGRGGSSTLSTTKLLFYQINSLRIRAHTSSIADKAPSIESSSAAQSQRPIRLRALTLIHPTSCCSEEQTRWVEAPCMDALMATADGILLRQQAALPELLRQGREYPQAA